eukprot:CAMPEP_0198155596 /NCGR_PEP_ID=MMETSP1443-20131203/69208_1 /TAXON_ID=186043 /ORGANISM="Entomoneis sp., Strain CCMP2396" /LENGTH=341 /DNA_ID=CAMNT_0043822351 /DNA_START=884 /DNA_END=1909 /DNA_ORIENTATION=+
MEQQQENSAALVPVLMAASGSALRDDLEDGAFGWTDEMDSSDVIANVVIAPSAFDDDVKSKDKDLDEGVLESNGEMCDFSAPSASNDDDVKSKDKDPEEGDLASTNEMDFSDACSLSLAVETSQRTRSGFRTPWSRERRRNTALGCLSSCVVLTIRLLLDREPTAYIIHSIVVFFDMILIHMFTNCTWLSVTGEITTVILFLAFHFTTETLFELLETTGLAILCSFHLIRSRNKHKHREEQLEMNIENIRLHTLAMMTPGGNDRVDSTGLLLENDEGMTSLRLDETFRSWVITEDPKSAARYVKSFGKMFFENFLDGSAGVMYTSFLGLIIDELLVYGQPK